MKTPGEHISDFVTKGKKYQAHKVSLDDESFHEQNYYL
jgi:hypothetical protein